MVKVEAFSFIFLLIVSFFDFHTNFETCNEQILSIKLLTLAKQLIDLILHLLGFSQLIDILIVLAQQSQNSNNDKTVIIIKNDIA